MMKRIIEKVKSWFRPKYKTGTGIVQTPPIVRGIRVSFSGRGYIVLNSIGFNYININENHLTKPIEFNGFKIPEGMTGVLSRRLFEDE